MTKKELRSKIAEFLNSQDAVEFEEWWTTNRGIAEVVMADFLTFLEGKPYEDRDLAERLTGEKR